jgi:hypothetical protein
MTNDKQNDNLSSLQLVDRVATSIQRLIQY